MFQVTFGNCLVNSSDSLNGIEARLEVGVQYDRFGPAVRPVATGSDGVDDALAVEQGPGDAARVGVATGPAKHRHERIATDRGGQETPGTSHAPM